MARSRCMIVVKGKAMVEFQRRQISEPGPWPTYAPVPVDAIVAGPVAIVKNDGRGFRIIHVASGKKVDTHFVGFRDPDAMPLARLKERIAASLERYAALWSILDGLPFNPGAGDFTDAQKAALRALASNPIWVAIEEQAA